MKERERKKEGGSRRLPVADLPSATYVGVCVCERERAREREREIERKKVGERGRGM